jgi:hypothetical protein
MAATKQEEDKKQEEEEEDFLSAMERRAREALTVAKPTAGTVSGGLNKIVRGLGDAASTAAGTPGKLWDSAMNGGEGVKVTLQKQKDQFNKSLGDAGKGVDEASGNLKDDLSARAKGVVTQTGGAARVAQGVLNAGGTFVAAPVRLATGAVTGAAGIEGGGVFNAAKDIGSDMMGSFNDIRRGAEGYVEGGRQMLVGEEDPSGAAAPNPASMDPKSPSFVGPPEPARKSIDPMQDLGGAGPVPTDAKAEPANPDRMAALFKVANGGDFDPNSRMDRQKMAQLQMLLDKDPELAKKSDTKIAMQWYKTMK